MARLDEVQNLFTDQDVSRVDMGEMPEEMGGPRNYPYPGKYVFRNPKSFDYDAREVEEKDDEGKKTGKKVKRLIVKLEGSNALTILEAMSPLNSEYVGDTVNKTISNTEFRYGKDKLWVSEMGWWLRALRESVPQNAQMGAWAQAVEKTSLRSFKADVEWDAFCDPERKRYVYDESQGKNIEDTHGGCGRRYAQNSYTRADGTKVQKIPTEIVEIQGQRHDVPRFAQDFDCECGASMRCFPRLRNYEPVEGQSQAAS